MNLASILASDSHEMRKFSFFFRFFDILESALSMIKDLFVPTMN